MAARWRTHWWPWLLLGLIVAIVCYLPGLDLAHSLLLGMAVAVAPLLVKAFEEGSRTLWPPLPFNRRDGVRREVSALQWSLAAGKEEKIAQRVRAALLAGLAARGITPAQSLPQALASARVAAWLENAEADQPSMEELTAALHAVRTLKEEDNVR